MPIKKKSKAGRPIEKVTLTTYIKGDVKCTIDTLRGLSAKDNFDKIVSALIGGFQRDLNVEEACLEAGIAKDTFYNWFNASDEFANRITKAKQRLKVHAKKVIADKVMSNDFEAAKWWAERRLKDEFSHRQEMTGKDGGPLDVRGLINYLDDETTD